MTASRAPDYWTVIMASLLVLALLFAGYWIFTYVQVGSDPWSLLPWFGIAALAIIVLGIIGYAGIRPRRRTP